MQSLIGPKDGVTGKQFETALKKHNKVHTSDLNALNTVGYKELFKSVEGTWSIDKAIEEIKKNSRRYAKRQLTWFKKNK